MLSEESSDFRLIDKEELGGDLSSLDLTEVELFSGSKNIDEAISYIRIKKIGVLVIGDTEIEGIVTENDFLKSVGNEFSKMKEVRICDIMSTSPTVLDLNTSILDAIEVMGTKNIRHLIVKDSSRIYVLLLKDLLNFAIERFGSDLGKYQSQVEWGENGVCLQVRAHFDDTSSLSDSVSAQIFETPLRRVMFNRAFCVNFDLSLAEVVEKMREDSTSNIILMEYETEMRGILTSRDLLLRCYGLLDFDSTLAKDVMTMAPHRLLEQDILAVAIKNMSEYKYRNVIVCNQVGYPISIVSILEMLKFICSKFL